MEIIRRDQTLGESDIAYAHKRRGLGGRVVEKRTESWAERTKTENEDGFSQDVR